MSMNDEQVRLFQRAAATVTEVPLLLVDGVGEGPRSTTGAAIKALGFTSAVLVRERQAEDGPRYEVIDGKRRVRDAIAAGMTSIPAVVVPAEIGDAELAALQVSMNLNRAPNPMEEAESLGRLRDKAVAAGIEAKEAAAFLAKQLGLSRAVVEQRLRLASLPAPVRRATHEGRVAATVASRIANLRESERAELIERLDDGGRLTALDVSEVRQSRHEASLGALPFALFEPEDAEQAVGARTDWVAVLADAVAGLTAAGRSLDDIMEAVAEAYDRVAV